MAYTQTDIDNLKSAMAKGVFEVEYAGQRVKYQSLDMMRRQLADMENEVGGSANTRVRFSDTVYDRECS